MELPAVDEAYLIETVTSLTAMTFASLAIVSKVSPETKADVVRLLLDARPTFFDGAIVAMIDHQLDTLIPRRRARDGD